MKNTTDGLQVTTKIFYLGKNEVSHTFPAKWLLFCIEFTFRRIWYL